MASNINGNSLISNLNHDVLSVIQTTNGNIFRNDSALEDTKSMSQVCRNWRSAMLTSSSTWARLIDVDRFRNCPDDPWANEVLRRAGNSLLWIKSTTLDGAKDQTRSKHLFEWLFNIIDTRWEQIERIRINTELDGIRIDKWDALYRPAPRLKEIAIDVPIFVGCHNWIGRPLFEGNVPSLCSFGIAFAKLSIETTWLRGLRSLTLKGWFTVIDLLNTLQMTPMLEYLQADQLAPRLWDGIDIFEDDHTADFSTIKIQLPKLQDIQISLCSLHNNSQFIERLVVEPTCSLSLDCIVDWEHNQSAFQQIFEPLAQVFNRHLEARHPNELFLDFHINQFMLRSHTPHGDKDNKPFISITLSTHHHNAPLPEYIPVTLLQELSHPPERFSKVSKLGLKHYSGYPGRLLDIIPTLTRSMTNVEVLVTDELTMENLRNEEIAHSFDNLENLFPKLHTINIDNFHQTYPDPHYRSPVHDFLAFRFYKIQKPINVLKLHSQWKDMVSLSLLSFLSELQNLFGMKIVWESC